MNWHNAITIGPQRYTYKVVLTLNCFACDATTEIDVCVTRGADLTMSLPTGWTHTAWWAPLCPRHDVVAVDREEE